MADGAQDPPSPQSFVPQKRPLQHDEPLEASSAPARTKLKEKNVHRESREKKDTWKKKEALNSGASSSALKGDAAASGNGGIAAVGANNGSGKQTGHNTPGGPYGGAAMSWPGLMRWRLPPPQEPDYHAHRAPPLTPSTIPDLPAEFFAVNDHPMNRRGFRYTPCEASRLLSSLSYRLTEYEPYTPRIAYEDMNTQVHINRTGTAITTEKGWRMARANVGVREGDWYYECKIVKGIVEEGIPSGHVRVGWARREAPLDAPVGFDAHSYGLRDQSGQKVHMSRPKDFLEHSFVTGDVIGLQIKIPPLSLQRELTTNPVTKSADIIRDRIPIRFKNQLWFEQCEYQPQKEMEDLMNPTSGNTKPGFRPRTLPGSFIKVYKNGEYVGTPWEDIYAFLPPASKPLASVSRRELDDGSLGYYPAVSVFRGGIVEMNFGPEWICPPKDEDMKGVRAMSERYDEQIAEDVTYDIIDEVDLLFTEENVVGPSAAATATADSVVGVKEEIKEMVMEDE
ncbi:transcription factor, contains a PHD finger motif [Rhizina undulata]